MSHEELTYAAGKAMGAADERERIAKFLEIYSVDWDCGHLEHDADEYSDHYEKYGETEDHEYDEFAAKACVRMELANWVRQGS